MRRKLTPEAEAAVELAGRKWLKARTARETLEAAIQRRVRAELDVEIRDAKLEFATAAQAALDLGATKTALKEVSSKNPGTLEEYLALLSATPEAEAATEETVPAVDVSVEWVAGDLLITLDPQQIETTENNRSDPDLWTGLYEVFVRPQDGKVFIDPLPTVPVLHGVTEWLRADPANEQRVIAWVKEHPAS